MDEVVEGERDGMGPLFWGDGADVDEVGDVVALPVFEKEGGGWDVRVAGDGEAVEGGGAFMEVVAAAVAAGVLDLVFVSAWVVVAEDEEEPGCVGILAHGGEEVLVDEGIDGDAAVVGREQVSSEKDSVWSFGVDGVV